MILSKWFTKAKESILRGKVNVIDYPVKVMLLDETYSPDQENHETLSDVVGEITGEGYSVGGKEVQNKYIDHDVRSVILKGDDVEWENSTISARYGVLYVDHGTKPLLGFYDFGNIKSSNNGIFRIRFNQNGILKMTVE